MLRARQKHSLGFSLVELMAVVVIVGILVSLALPRFRLFIATARQAEAHANLGIIASLQQTYYLKYDKYFTSGLSMGDGTCGLSAEKNELGFRNVNCDKLRYKYSATSGGGEAKASGANPREIYPNCAKPDNWSIDDKRVLKHETNVIKTCHE